MLKQRFMLMQEGELGAVLCLGGRSAGLHHDGGSADMSLCMGLRLRHDQQGMAHRQPRQTCLFSDAQGLAMRSLRLVHALATEAFGTVSA